MIKPSEAPPNDASTTDVGASPLAIKGQLNRILESDGFRESRRMAHLLRFIVSEALAGNAHRLKEYVIALEVFGRDESFDPRTNALVRVEASRLRHRLREYALGAGRDDAIHVELPSGSYVPRFRTAGVAGSTSPVSRPPEKASTERLDRPSIAVLPFVILGDKRPCRFHPIELQEDLIVALSRNRWLLVAASRADRPRQAMDAKRAGREAGVRYVFGGTVRQVGRRTRVFAELIDAETGNVLWARRYEVEVDVYHDLQEAVVVAVASAVEVRLAAAERERAARCGDVTLDAWAMYQKGLDHMYRFNFEDSRRAKELFRLAAAANARFASPLGALAYADFLDFVLGFTDAPGRTIGEAVEAGRAAVERDLHDPMAHFGLARALSLTGKLSLAMSALGNSIELNPGFAPAHLGVGGALSLAGRHGEAIAALDRAITLSPDDPMLWTMENIRAISNLELGRFDQAAVDARRAAGHPNTVPWCYMTLIAALSNLQRDDDARAVSKALFERWPDFSVPRFAATVPFNPAVTHNWRSGIRRAGLGGV